MCEMCEDNIMYNKYQNQLVIETKHNISRYNEKSYKVAS